jgi:hypothetical protein
VQVKVTDSGSPALSRTNSFSLTVNGKRTWRLLTVPFDQTQSFEHLDESASATWDSDIPANFSDLRWFPAPIGMTTIPPAA